MPLRYYLYVSKSKVDQLFEQIPAKRLGKIAKKLTIDLKAIKVEFGGVGEPPSQQSVYAKLRIVEDYLNREEVLYDVDDPELVSPGTFFAGVMPLRWGRLLGTAPGNPSGVVYFSGRTRKTMLGMGGSERHVVGAAEGAQSIGFASGRPDLIEAMQHSQEFAQDNESWIGHQVPDALPGLMWHAEVKTGPAAKMRFLGVMLQLEWFDFELPDDKNKVRRALLGTPLYVAFEQ